MLTLADRADLYNSAFDYPGRPPLVATERWLAGVWALGRYYKGSGYYGAYPPGYLERVGVLFPEYGPDDTLHLFSGSLPAGLGVRVDLRPGADIVGDAHHLSDLVDKQYGLILADPPYSKEDAKRYGAPMVDRRKVVAECAKVLKPGVGFLVWLDTVWPMFRKDTLTLVGTIGVMRSTNHRVRMVFVFAKVDCTEGQCRGQSAQPEP